MADDNRPLKYLRYAIGEIVLVVIGILIALSINNWNERKKESEKENSYLERLSVELNKDLIYYDSRLSKIKEDNQHLDEYLKGAYEHQNNISEVKKLFGNLIFLNTDHLSISNSTFLELISTGDLKIMRNDSLKKSILDYYSTVDRLSMNIQEFNTFTTDHLVNTGAIVNNFGKLIIGDDYEHAKFDELEWVFINSPHSSKFQSIENSVLLYYYRNLRFVGHFEELKQVSSNLKRQISTEL